MAKRRKPASQAKVRSTTQRLATGTKPRAAADLMGEAQPAQVPGKASTIAFVRDDGGQALTPYGPGR